MIFKTGRTKQKRWVRYTERHLCDSSCWCQRLYRMSLQHEANRACDHQSSLHSRWHRERLLQRCCRGTIPSHAAVRSASAPQSMVFSRAILGTGSHSLHARCRVMDVQRGVSFREGNIRRSEHHGGRIMVSNTENVYRESLDIPFRSAACLERRCE